MTARVGCLIAIAYPIVEIALAVAIAHWIGWWWLLVFVVVCIVLGLGLVRYALGATGRSFTIAIAALRTPGTESNSLAIAGPLEGPTKSGDGHLAPPAQTLLIVPAGLLIALPGVITTAGGLILWTPAVRRRIARRIEAATRRLN
ncbi:MAG: FxsA family protein [Candidatus Nanopelagicales bacterium]